MGIRRAGWTVLLAAFLLAGSFPVLASGNSEGSGTEEAAEELTQDGKITVTKTYEADASGYETPELFGETLLRDGRKYQLISVSYDVTDKEPEIYVAEPETRWETESFHPDEAIRVNGKEFVLTDIRMEEHVETGRILPVSETVELIEDEVEDFMEVTGTDPVTGETVSQRIPLTEKAPDHTKWISSLSLTITFHGYDNLYCQIGDLILPKGEEKPELAGMEGTILAMSGFDPAKNQITDTAWSSPVYRLGEETCRDAIATGNRLVAVYRCTYEGDLILPDLKKITYQSVYEEVQDGDPVYVTAAAIYEREPWWITHRQAVLSVTALILIAGIICILLLIGKRKKKKEK